MYPDAVVVCGEIDFADDQARNPVAVFEVLSRSTESEDRGPKFVAYRSIGTLRHYVLIAQEARRAEVFSRSGDEWTFRIVEPPQALHLPDIGAELRLDDIYEDSGR
jgi:Uma2 family endonuclease